MKNQLGLKELVQGGQLSAENALWQLKNEAKRKRNTVKSLAETYLFGWLSKRVAA